MPQQPAGCPESDGDDNRQQPHPAQHTTESFHDVLSPTIVSISLVLPKAAGRRSTDGIQHNAVWAPPRPTLAVVMDEEADVYEVCVYDRLDGQRLVAAIELVSPANKDRPEHRGEFIAKCAAMLRSNVCVTIVDVETTRSANLYGDLIALFGQTDPSLADGPLYAATCRWIKQDDCRLLETWSHRLGLGEPLPTLPLWLADNLSIPLNLELSYEETCRSLRLL